MINGSDFLGISGGTISSGLVVQFTLRLLGTFELFYEATIGIGWLAYEGLSCFSFSFFLAWRIVAYYWLHVSRFLFEGNWRWEDV